MATTNREVAQAFLARETRPRHSNNLHYAGDALTSYKTPVARWIDRYGRTALLIHCGEGMSITTKTKHLVHLRNTGDRTAFYVLDVGADSVGLGHGLRLRAPDHGANVRNYWAESAAAEQKAARARVRKNWRLTRAREVSAGGSAYCQFFDLANPFAPETTRDHLQRAALQGDPAAAAALHDLDYETGRAV